ncbi:MAG: methyltransferase [Conexivisphaera sp.]
MSHFVVNGVKIYYEPELSGGGRSFGMLYVPIVRRVVGHARRCLEAFSGPGFIGFSLVAHGLCDELVLADINPKAIECVRSTVIENGLDDRVRYYESDVLDGIPANEQFDLVVANPPHFNENTISNHCKGSCNDLELLKSFDRNWELHRKFYSTIGAYLNKGGKVILVENSDGSRAEEFIPMIEE